MKFDTFGEGEDLLFLMGWGNTVDGSNVRWFIDRLTDAGYRVHAGELPTNISDFEAEYVQPAREYRDGNALQLAPVIGHSTGGLVAPYLQPKVAVYLSPWWGFYGLKLRARAVNFATKLPVETPIIPLDFDREELGGLVSQSQWADLPHRVSPTFTREIRWAQQSLPDVSDDAHVFCSLKDTIVGLDGIGEQVAPEQVTLYDGQHELFSSEGREDHAEAVVEALDERV
ncbi:MAG: alpha/beta fold hydrolase [Halorientalis sp.]